MTGIGRTEPRTGGATFAAALLGVIVVSVACAGNLLIWLMSWVISSGGGALMAPSVIRDVLGALLVLTAAIRLLRVASAHRGTSSHERPDARPEGSSGASAPVRAMLVGLLGVAVSLCLALVMTWAMPDLYQRGLLFTPLLFAVGVLPAAVLLLMRVDSIP
ncbi:hypothetical protein [Leucobacter sp. GX24907]